MTLVRGAHVVATTLVSQGELVAKFARAKHHVATAFATNRAKVAVTKNIGTRVAAALIVVIAMVAGSQQRFGFAFVIVVVAVVAVTHFVQGTVAAVGTIRAVVSTDVVLCFSNAGEK